MKMMRGLEEWDVFVLRHRNPGNLFVHFVSWLMFFGGPFAAVMTKNPYYLLLFFASGAVGAFGHYCFRDSGVSLKEATSSAKVPVFVTKMFWLLMTRQYWKQVEDARLRALACGYLREPERAQFD